MRLAAGAFSDVGRVRDGNEDAYVVDDRLALFAVADGMGGHRGGEVASWTAIEAVRAAIAAGRPVHDAITTANDAVRERAADDPGLAGMGTTMTAVVVTGGDRLLIGHVGDSRAYLLHDGELRRLTDDHSLVEELVREGRLTPEQAEAHPQRAIITRALGVDDDVEVDLYTVPVAVGDRLVICSDGLTTMVRERDLERIARRDDDPQQAAEALVDEANRAGGEDNITVVVLDVLEVDATGAPDPELLAAAVEPRSPSTPARAPDVPPPAIPEPKESTFRRVRGVLLVAVPLVVILAVAFGTVAWYARRSYFVGEDDGNVALFRGVPGGLFVWDPELVERTDLAVDELLPIDEQRVEGETVKGSRDEAQRFITRLEAQTTSTTTTSTTRPRATTTTTTAVSPTTTGARVP